MKFNHIHFIINPASGKEEPILSYINDVLKEEVNWDLSVSKKSVNAGEIAATLIDKTDLVVVYGGDGTVSAVASALHRTNTLMAIIPGGTANIMAKELGIPLDPKAALELLISDKCQIRPIDMGVVNGFPFLLRVNLGIMADMVIQADRELKDKLGQLAYGITAVKTIADAEVIKYKLEIDDKIVEEEGVSLTITNVGNMGVGDFALQPGININDGLLDIILLKHVNFTSLLKVAGSTLLQNETNAVKHWKCRQVTISMARKQKFICDDREEIARKLTIKVAHASIKILVPTED